MCDDTCPIPSEWAQGPLPSSLLGLGLDPPVLKPCSLDLGLGYEHLFLVRFDFNMNIMFLTHFLTYGHIPTLGESNKPNKVFHGLSNQQTGNKFSLTPGPPEKPGSDTMLKDQFS